MIDDFNPQNSSQESDRLQSQMEWSDKLGKYNGYITNQFKY